jgi:hypothetical protein
MKKKIKNIKQLEKMKKAELISYIIYDCFDHDQLNERYDQGFDAGYDQGQRDNRDEIPADELHHYGVNVISFTEFQENHDRRLFR